MITNNHRGFTLIELLINIGVISILLAVSFWGYKQRNEGIALERASQKLVMDVERAREMGMSSKEFNGAIPKGGYGVYFSSASSKSYILFADLNDNKVYDPSSEKMEEVSLENNIYIKNISPSSFCITFKPPSPEVTITTQNSTIDSASVTLGAKSLPFKKRTIKFNIAGLITSQ